MKICKINYIIVFKTKLKYIILVFAVLFSSCSQPKDFSQNAKLRAGYWISCVQVKKGMYNCKVYTRWRKILLTDKNYVYPFFYKNFIETDLSGKITGFEGDRIIIEGNRKLFATDMPQDAVRIQGLKDGVWISAKPVAGKDNVFTCIVYDIKGSNILSSGEYVVKKFYWDNKAGRTKYMEVKQPLKVLDLIYYGGIGISLKNKMVLLPTGWIDYPDPEGLRGGLRVKYDSGANVIKQQEY